MFCKFPKTLWHDWGQWTVFAEATIARRYSKGGVPVEGSTRIEGQAYQQSRVCACCGLTQYKQTKLKV